MPTNGLVKPFVGINLLEIQNHSPQKFSTRNVDRTNFVCPQSNNSENAAAFSAKRIPRVQEMTFPCTHHVSQNVWTAMIALCPFGAKRSRKRGFRTVRTILCSVKSAEQCIPVNAENMPKIP